MAVSYFVPSSTGFTESIKDRTELRYYRLKVDVLKNNNFVDLTDSLQNNNISGGGSLNQGSVWNAVLRNVGGTYQEGDMAGSPCTIEAKVGINEYIIIFTGFVDRKGVTRKLGMLYDDTITIKMYDYTKHSGSRKKTSFYSLVNFTVAEKVDSGSSIIHRLAFDMGLTASQINVYATLDYVKDYLPLSNDNTALSELQNLNEAYLGKLNFRYDGKLNFVSPFMVGYSTPNTEWTLDNSNVHKLTIDGGDIVANKVKTQFDDYETLDQRVIHKNLSLWNVLFEYNEIPVLAGEYWPGGAVEGNTATLKYKDPSSGEDWAIGINIKTPSIDAYTTSATADILCDGGVLTLHSFNGVTGTDSSLTEREPDGAQIILKNETGSTVTIRKLTIKGEPLRILSTVKLESIDNSAATEDIVEKTIDGKYMSSSDQAYFTARWWQIYGSTPRKKINLLTDWLPQVQVGSLVDVNIPSANYPPSGLSDIFVVDKFSHRSPNGAMGNAKTELSLSEHVDFTATGSPDSQTQEYNGSAGAEQSDIVAGQIEDRITYTEVQEGYDQGGGTTTPTQVTILKCEPVGIGGVLLVWDVQLDLTNFDHYDLQVSDDDSTWYSLEFDGTDWKDTLAAVTSVDAAFLVHAKIPSLGTADAPLGKLLYYRIRRVTKDATNGTYSASSSTTTLIVSSGDVGANSVYANNIVAAEINTMLLRATSTIIAGFSGSGSNDAPLNYDRRTVIDDDEMRSEEYKDGAWAENIKVGGQLSGRQLTMVRSNGMYTQDSITSFEVLPAGDFICFPFNGSLWDTKYRDIIVGGNILFNSSTYKFGNSSIEGTGTPPYTRAISYSPSKSVLISNDYTMGGWVYINSATIDFKIMERAGGSSNYHAITYDQSAGTIFLSIKKGGVTSDSSTISVSTGTWIYVASTYVNATNTAILIVNGSSTTFNPTGTWDAIVSPNFYFLLKSDFGAGIRYDVKLDDIFLSLSTAMGSTDLLKHYTNDSAWVETMTKEDILISSDKDIILSAPNGRVNILSSNYMLLEDNNGPDYTQTIPDNMDIKTVILSSGSFNDTTIVLPSLANSIGRQITFINENATSDLIIERAGTDTINGMTTYEIPAGYLYLLSFIGGATEWRRTENIFVSIPEASRPSNWVLSGGTATSWTDVNFSSYTPAGARGLLLKYLTRWDGDGAADFSIWAIRENGSTVTDIEQIVRAGVAYNNMPGSITSYGNDGQIITSCDSDRIIEYQEILVTRTGGAFYLSIDGFYI